MSQCYREQLVEAIREVLPGQFFRSFAWPAESTGRRSGWWSALLMGWSDTVKLVERFGSIHEFLKLTCPRTRNGIML